MRGIILALALAACGQQGAPAHGEDGYAGSSGAGRIEAPPFVLEPEALVGLWSFDRTCGLYDLVFQADDRVEYFDYNDPAATASYAGTWSVAEDNRVALALRQLDAEGRPTGEEQAFTLALASPVTDDLIGDFFRVGGDAQALTARRCAEEDRD